MFTRLSPEEKKAITLQRQKDKLSKEIKAKSDQITKLRNEQRKLTVQLELLG